MDLNAVNASELQEALTSIGEGISPSDIFGAIRNSSLYISFFESSCVL